MAAAALRRSFAFFLTALFTLFLGSAVQAQVTVPGSVPGEFAVTPNGAASYRIPIAVPPGVSGMEPKLALAYSSQAGNGLMGVGWSIEGLSAITRCGSTMASEGARKAVQYNSEDRFCFDGQKLISVNGVYATDGAEYRTELESFSRIQAWGAANGAAANGPAYFTVQTKAGLQTQWGHIDAMGSSLGSGSALLSCVAGGNPALVTVSRRPSMQPCRRGGNSVPDA